MGVRGTPEAVSPQQAVWRKRFLVFMAARLFGLLTFLAGLAIAFSDLLREGGWPQVGAILIILGAIDAVFAPRLLKRSLGSDSTWAVSQRAPRSRVGLPSR